MTRQATEQLFQRMTSDAAFAKAVAATPETALADSDLDDDERDALTHDAALLTSEVEGFQRRGPGVFRVAGLGIDLGPMKMEEEAADEFMPRGGPMRMEEEAADE